MKNKPFIIALTGAESTGKSTLAEALAKHYEVPFIPEFARDYVRNIHRKYTYEDVEFIARQQIEQYEKFVSENRVVVILDTWLLITKVWFDVVFHQVPEWLDESIQKYKIDLFLVCDTDLPWEADDVRENGGENRNKLQERYINEIRSYNFPYEIIQGVDDARVQNAVKSIESVRSLNQQN